MSFRHRLIPLLSVSRRSKRVVRGKSSFLTKRLCNAFGLFAMLFRGRGLFRASPSHRLLTVIAAFSFFVAWGVVLHSRRTATDVLRSSSSSHWFGRSLLRRQAEFWQVFFEDLERYGPKYDSIIPPEEGGDLDVFFNESDHRPRPDRLRMWDGQFSAIHSAHANFVRRLKEREYTFPYNENTRGIVTTADGPYLAVALVSIRMLRRTGSTLPVEVFLALKEEFDPEICGVILPSLNAHCMILQDIFDLSSVSNSDFKIAKYQYKVMSILFSSFKDVLFLDSDCFPTSDPDQLFDSEPFLTTGMVLWPDFWFPSESPLFFKAAEISAPPIYTQASTESGEILYSKSKHNLSIMLATYYNYYGPEFYYPMQSQGAPGEGDKETFLWSAVALSEPFYKVKTGVVALGYWTTTHEWRGSAMLQFDPTQDMQIVEGHGEFANFDRPRPFFVHANFPKFSPATIFLNESFGASGPTRDADGTIRRIWHEDSTVATALFGFDLERRLWREIRDIACEYEDTISAWKGEKDICANATIYWQTLFGNDTSMTKNLK
jgi:alpha 1,2-mannosyltransferase